MLLDLDLLISMKIKNPPATQRFIFVQNVLRSLQNLKKNDLCLALLGNYYNTFSNKSWFCSAFPSRLNRYLVFPSHQVGSLIHHIEYISAAL